MRQHFSVTPTITTNHTLTLESNDARRSAHDLHPLPNVEGFVLIGGASSRMGADKCSLLIDGVQISDRLIARLAAVTTRARLVGRRREDAPAGASSSQPSPQHRPPASVCDVYRAPEGCAPRCALTGLHAALWHARTEWVVVLACDLPFVTSELILALAARRPPGDPCDDRIEAIVPVQPDGRLQPLCAIYRRMPALRRATEALDAGDYALRSFLNRLHTREVAAAELAALPGADRFFFNLNTPEDFAAATEQMEQSARG